MHDPDLVAGALLSEDLVTKSALPGEDERTQISGKIMRQVLSKVESDPLSLYQFINAVDPEGRAQGGAFTDACNRLRQKVGMPIKSECVDTSYDADCNK